MTKRERMHRALDATLDMASEEYQKLLAAARRRLPRAKEDKDVDAQRAMKAEIDRLEKLAGTATGHQRVMDAAAAARDEHPAELAWRAATYAERGTLLKRAGLSDFHEGHGWRLLPEDVKRKLERLFR